MYRSSAESRLLHKAEIATTIARVDTRRAQKRLRQKMRHGVFCRDYVDENTTSSVETLLIEACLLLQQIEGLLDVLICRRHLLCFEQLRSNRSYSRRSDNKSDQDPCEAAGRRVISSWCPPARKLAGNEAENNQLPIYNRFQTTAVCNTFTHRIPGASQNLPKCCGQAAWAVS
jgi:hypothetical protein